MTDENVIQFKPPTPKPKDPYPFWFTLNEAGGREVLRIQVYDTDLLDVTLHPDIELSEAAEAFLSFVVDTWKNRDN